MNKLITVIVCIFLISCSTVDKVGEQKIYSVVTNITDLYSLDTTVFSDCQVYKLRTDGQVETQYSNSLDTYMAEVPDLYVVKCGEENIKTSYETGGKQSININASVEFPDTTFEIKKELKDK